jgi:site-specific DNA recombinase
VTSAAIYARVSSARQKDEQTIASQTAALHGHAEQLGVDVPPEWVFEDDGYSGATLVRPALERLRDLLAQVPVDVVLCYSPDRLARKYAYQVLLVEEFSRAGVEVRFVKGPAGDSPEDALLVQFQGMIAEYERAQIAERTRRGKAHRARAGVANVLSGAPFGYRYVRRSEHAEARYEVIEHEAAVVAEMFRRYVEDGTSIAGLLRWLSDSGALTRTGKTRWDRSTVAGMLHNPAYAGHAAFGKTMSSPDRPAPNRVARQAGRGTPRSTTATVDRPHEDWVHIPVPPIISEDTFARTQRRLADNKHFAARNTKVPSLLQGLLICPSCSYACYRTSTRTTAGKIYYYRCLGSDDWRYEHGRVCTNTPVRADYLDEVVWTHITGLLTDPALITAELDRRLDQTRAADPATAQRTRLDLALAKTTASITRLIEAYQEQLLSLDELRARMPELRARETSLRTQLDALAAQLVDRDTYLKLAENLESFLTRLQDKAQAAAVEERQQVLRLLVKEILVGPERITIRHCIPTTTPDPTPGYLLRGRSHGAVLPVLHVARVGAGDGDHRLDAVRGAQGAGQRRWHAQS